MSALHVLHPARISLPYVRFAWDLIYMLIIIHIIFTLSAPNHANYPASPPPIAMSRYNVKWLKVLVQQTLYMRARFPILLSLLQRFDSNFTCMLIIINISTFRPTHANVPSPAPPPAPCPCSRTNVQFCRCVFPYSLYCLCFDIKLFCRYQQKKSLTATENRMVTDPDTEGDREQPY